MTDTLRLRNATMDDAEILLSWRNDEATRRASRNQTPVGYEEHTQWLNNALENDRRTILIAELDGIPAATVRLDKSADEHTELSWTVSPDMRGLGLGKRCVKKALENLEGPIVAYVKPENIASQKIAEAVGLIKVDGWDRDGMFRFEIKK